MDRGLTVFSNRIERRQLKPGDHIYAWRRNGAKIYSHHGIYESDKKVIHFTAQSSSGSTSYFGFSSSATAFQTCDKCRQAILGGGVSICCLNCFLEGEEPRLFAYGVSRWFFAFSSTPQPQRTCTTQAEDPPETVLRRANDLLAQGIVGFGDYNLVLRNCMDFAFFCKTGHHYYGLVRDFFLIDWVGWEPQFLREIWGPPQGQV